MICYELDLDKKICHDLQRCLFEMQNTQNSHKCEKELIDVGKFEYYEVAMCAEYSMRKIPPLKADFDQRPPFIKRENETSWICDISQEDLRYTFNNSCSTFLSLYCLQFERCLGHLKFG